MPLSLRLENPHFSYMFNQPGKTAKGSSYFSNTIRFVTLVDKMNVSELIHLLDGLGIELDDIDLDSNFTNSDEYSSFKISKQTVKYGNTTGELSLEKTSQSSKLRLSIQLAKSTRDKQELSSPNSMLEKLLVLFTSVTGSSQNTSEIISSVTENVQTMIKSPINPGFESFSDLGANISSIYSGLPKDTTNNWKHQSPYTATTIPVHVSGQTQAAPTSTGTVVGFMPSRNSLAHTVAARAPAYSSSSSDQTVAAIAQHR